MYYNPVNTARGLLDGLATAVRVGDEGRAEEFRAELRAVAPAVAAVDSDNLDEDERRDLAQVRAGLSSADVDGDAKGNGRRGPRTAKAAPAPEAAVPPAPK
jgi:hypothetical protein